MKKRTKASRNGRRDRSHKNLRCLSSRWPANWFMGLLLIVLFTVAAILHVRSRHAVVHLGYQLSEATSEHEKLMADHRKLQVEVATLKSPRRLRELATGSLGLMEPTASQIVHLKSEPKRKLAMGDR